jgi:hypothetical protein
MNFQEAHKRQNEKKEATPLNSQELAMFNAADNITNMMVDGLREYVRFIRAIIG